MKFDDVLHAFGHAIRLESRNGAVVDGALCQYWLCLPDASYEADHNAQYTCDLVQYPGKRVLVPTVGSMVHVLNLR